jgi:hypothetical protein
VHGRSERHVDAGYCARAELGLGEDAAIGLARLCAGVRVSSVAHERHSV